MIKKSRILSFVLLLIFVNCSHDPIVKKELGRISTMELNVTELEVVIISVEEKMLDKDNYEAHFGSLTIDLQRKSNTELILIVPWDIGDGIHELSVDFASNVLVFTTSSITLEDTPENIVNAEISAVLVDISTFENQGYLSASQVEYLSSEYSRLMNEFGNLNNDKKIEVAKFLRANKSLLEELFTRVDNLAVISTLEINSNRIFSDVVCTGTDEEIASCITRELENTVKWITYSSIGAIVTAGTGIGPFIFATSALSRVYMLSETVWKSLDKPFIIKSLGFKNENINGRLSTSTFENGVAYPIDIEIFK